MHTRTNAILVHCRDVLLTCTDVQDVPPLYPSESCLEAYIGYRWAQFIVRDDYLEGHLIGPRVVPRCKIPLAAGNFAEQLLAWVGRVARRE